MFDFIKKHNCLWSAIEILPVALPSGLAIFSIFGTFLLVIDQLSSQLALLGFVISISVGLYLVARWSPTVHTTSIERKLINTFVVVFVLGWTGFNLHYSSQSVFVYRDPAIYAVNGIHLIEHKDLDLIPADNFENPLLKKDSAGFALRPTAEGEQLKPQGLRLLSIYIGLVGRIVGQAHALGVNVVIGGVTLLAFYGFARLLGKPRWAALATVSLSLSLPFMYFSRDTFSEPLSLMFTFTALSLLWIGMQRNNKWTWGAAGLAAGATTLARIDGFLLLITIALFILIKLATSLKKERKLSLIQGALFGIGATTAYITSYLDLTRIGNAYQHAQRNRMLLLLGVILIGGSLTCWVSWRMDILKRIEEKTRGKRVVALTILALIICGVMFSRPFWLVGHHNKSLPLVGGIQAAEGMAIDPTRDYSEATMNWLMWYLGPLLVLMGLIGLVVASRRIVDDRKSLLLPSVVTIVGISALFLNKPSITPDQVWATRRLLPVILPGLAAYSVLGFTAFEDWLEGKKKRPSMLLYGAAVIGVFLPILYTSSPYFRAATKVGQLTQIQEVCRRIPSNTTVVWLGSRAFNAVQTTATFCGRPSLRLELPTQENIKNVTTEAKKRNIQIVFVIFDSDIKRLSENAELSLVSSVAYDSIPSTLKRPPRITETTKKSIYMAYSTADGELKPLSLESSGSVSY